MDSVENSIRCTSCAASVARPKKSNYSSIRDALVALAVSVIAINPPICNLATGTPRETWDHWKAVSSHLSSYPQANLLTPMLGRPFLSCSYGLIQRRGCSCASTRTNTPVPTIDFCVVSPLAVEAWARA